MKDLQHMQGQPELEHMSTPGTSIGTGGDHSPMSPVGLASQSVTPSHSCTLSIDAPAGRILPVCVCADPAFRLLQVHLIFQELQINARWI